MPLSTSRKAQITLLSLLSILLLGGFLATSLVSYFASRDSIRHNIVNTELPLTSDNIYSEIQKDLIRPTQIASMMSRDTFLRDWVIAGEQDAQPMTRYLREVQDHYGTFTSFFISEKSRTYYQAKGVLKQIREDEPRDAWYFRVRNMAEPYEISVDPDMANADRLTFFINFKVFDYQHNFIGVAGVGLTVDAVVKLVDDYQRRYDRAIYFTDRNGRLVLTSADGGPMGAHRGQLLSEVAGLEPLLAVLPQPKSGRFDYQEGGRGHFLNVRYIPELDWFLFVDKHEEGALAGIRHSLFSDTVEVRELHWQGAVEALLAPYRHLILLDNPVDRARVRLFLLNFEKELFVHVSALESRATKGNEKALEKARAHIRDRLTQLAPVFLKNKYMLGENFSMLDVAIAPLLWRLDYYGIELSKNAAPLLKYAERIFSRPAYIEALTPSEKVMRK